MDYLKILVVDDEAGIRSGVIRVLTNFVVSYPFMDEDIGFLPGTEEEKIAPYMRPVIDNLEILMDADNKDKFNHELELRDKIQELFDRNIINTEAIAFIRGRSIVNQWVIIDEAQNLTPHEVKTIITRAGEGR